MNRRTFLASAGIAISTPLVGCVSETGTPDDGTGTTEGTTTGTVTDDTDTPAGEVVATETLQYATGSGRQDWHRGPGDPTGRVVVIDSEDRARAALPREDVPDGRRTEIGDFLQATDFDESVLLYVQSAGPDLCHDRIEFESIALEDDAVTGTATVLDTSEADQACAEAVAYPSALVRVTFDGDPATETRLTVVDGWGEEATVTASAEDSLSPEPEDLAGHVRPDGEPPVVPAALECDREGVERVRGWTEEDDLQWGETTDDGEPELALRVDCQECALGETVTVEMTNVTDEIQYTGNRHKYGLEVRTEAGWQDVRVHDEDEMLGYTDEAIGHRPGEGFEWTFELTETGVLEGHAHEDALEVCPDLGPGRYRFVVWEQNVAVAFDVTE